MEFSRQSPNSSTQPDSTGTSTGGTSLESTIMVPNVTSDVGQKTTPRSSVIRNDLASVPEQCSRHCTPTSHMGCIRDRCQAYERSLHQKTPLPRYTYTWDVYKVTSYISSLDDNP